MKKLALTCLPLLSLLTACETNIDVPEPEHTPRVALLLTLDNLAPADSMRRVDFPGRQPFVSVSQRLYTLNRPQGRNDATIEVRNAGGTVVERYRHVSYSGSGGSMTSDGTYRPVLKHRFQPGQEYSVRVTVPGVEPAESQLTMPTTVPVDASLTRLPARDGMERVRITLSFDDPGNSSDYYLAAARVLDANGNVLYSMMTEDEGDGTVAVTPYKLSNPSYSWGLFPFTDSNVNGQRISFTNVATYFSGGGWTPPGGGRPTFVEVTLTHLSRDLYLFMNSLRLYSDNNGNPFAEPTPLYSNVRPGFGLFGASADASVRIRL